uniref:Ig-like domain-containing protein n=1 Tax=Plectus sambesii TaxID=2011161 RepID=A0A914UM58_9BILA
MQATKVGVLLAGNPLQCGCIRQELVNNQGKILDIAMARCKDDKDASIWPLSNAPSDSCRPEPIIPFGTSVVASVGATLSIFCAAKTYSNQLIWTLPDKEQMMPKREQLIAPPTDSPDHLYGRPVTTGDYSSSNSVQRLNATAEQLRFDVLLPVDSGTYQCAIKQDKHVSHRTINLTVYRPAIIIYPLEIGSHYVTVAWNASLSISSAHVRAYIYVKENGVANRAIMLSIGNPWYSYNVMRLRPDSNYTLCLTYMLGVNETIFETCTDVTTQAPLTLLSTLNLSVLFTLLIFAGLIALVCTARCLHRRFYIWQEEKYRSRMNQSISGQSFLSSNDSVASRSITYENNLPMSMSNYSNASSLASSRCTTGRRSHRPSRDLSIRDMAL